MRDEISELGMAAMTTLSAINAAHSTRKISTWRDSAICGRNWSRTKSSVSVELEVITSEESVLMEAESTSTITMPISRSFSWPPNMAGTMPS